MFPSGWAGGWDREELMVVNSKTGTICGKAKEVAWLMEPLGSFPRVLNVLPREKIEGPLRDFLKANPRSHPEPDQRPLVFGLAEDVAKGLPLENSEEGLQYSSEGVH